MPAPPLPEHIRSILALPNPCVLSCVRPDGQPVSVATWYLVDGDQVMVNMDESRARLRYLAQDPRVSLTVLHHEGWSTHVSLQGRIERMVPDDDLRDIDRLSQRYLGMPYRDRNRGRVTAWIAVTAWHAWGPLVKTRLLDRK
jgi:PPOX class probable F420-dependent enzyme